MGGQNCGLHPLIHTLLKFNLAQRIVAWSQEVKCGLKYESHTSSRSVRTLSINDLGVLNNSYRIIIERSSSKGGMSISPLPLCSLIEKVLFLPLGG